MEIRMILSVVLLWLVLACGPRPVIEPFAPESIKPVIAGKEGWEAEWEKVVEGARKEGRVVIYASIPNAPMKEPFQRKILDRYNIKMDLLVGKGTYLDQKLQAEMRAGLYLVDLVLTSPTSGLLVTPKSKGQLGPLEPTLILPEVRDEKYWYGGEERRWIDKERTMYASEASVRASVAINTDLVKPGEITSYLDLLNPKWKEKIITENLTQGSVSSSLFAVGEYIMGWDFVKQLVKQKPLIVPEELVTLWLVRGKYPIALKTSELEEFVKAGAPVKPVLLKEGAVLTVGTTVLSLMKTAPHPNAANLFINLYLSKEGQTIFSLVRGKPSMREDVPTQHIDPVYLRQPGVKYVTGDSKEFISKLEEFREGYALEMMTELMK